MRRNTGEDQEREAFAPPGRTPKEDVSSVMKFYKLPKAFPPQVLEEALEAERAGLSDAGKRMDLRRRFIFTCDPDTARDFDDALSLETDRRGNRVLGVHIADVGHYVRPGSAIDREAYKRGTSVYLCGSVVPMLPEALSNVLCSLVPGEDRLAFSVFVTFDAKGRAISRRFAKSIIRSKARFTYGQVMDIISGQIPAGVQKTAAKTIRSISKLAQQIRASRFALGALDLEVPEAEVKLDDRGEMSGIEMRPYDESHQMVEECMVAANEAVAAELWTNGIKILARLHEPPDEEKLQSLRVELRGMGVKVGDLSKPKVFAQFMQSIKTHPLYQTIALMVLRSMKRAVYDPSAIGHFGLAKKYYAHFTSPIRRYPDLTLHRQLAAYLVRKDSTAIGKTYDPRIPPRLLERWAAQSNEREELAAEAERSILEIKKFRLLEKQLKSGRPVEYEAVVSKCMPFGCFVEIPDIAASGLVHVSLLSNRFVDFNQSDQTLSAVGGGRWAPGMRMKVCIARVDFEGRRLDFAPVRPLRRTKALHRNKRYWK
jgi:ribonuclease R